MGRYKVVLSFLFFTFVISTTTLLAVDTDGDGLSDDTEAQLGSSQLHKDIFVEVDWLVVNGKSMKPKGNFVQIVQSIFEDAPVTNPDGTTGIRIHVQMSQGIPVGNGIAYANDWAEFDGIKNNYFTPSRWGTHHYCLFIDAVLDADGYPFSGISRNIPSSDFVVALGPNSGFFNKPSPADYKWTQVGTFVHELGHNLGLRHGGVDDISYKPNHLSVMSYAYQVDGIPFTAIDGSRYYLYDYSRYAQDSINENAANEAKGLGPHASTNTGNYGVSWYLTADYVDFFRFEDFDGTYNVDWNQSGTIENTKVDLNPMFPYTPSGSVQPFLNLKGGPPEWTRLKYNGGLIGKSSGMEAVQTATVMCLRSSDLASHRIQTKGYVKRGTFRNVLLKSKKVESLN